MIYVNLICFVMAMIFMFRSMFGYEEINPNKVLDKIVLSLLWLNLALSFLEDVFKYMSN
ncbi:hypothetical protein phiA019_0174 [Aeromonas phage phiA019]|nr:hypothetical protein phiA009_0177 [Aeromonas phage phiA009]ULG01710.1 hypothetical protein phiA019_0174 [Aeromonas phage phiA019]